MPQLQSLEHSNQEAILGALDQDGACIALDLLSVELCNALLADFSPHLEALGVGVDELGYREAFYGEQTQRLHGLFSKSVSTEAVLVQPLMLALCQKMLVETGLARDIRLSNAELMVLHQGQTQQVYHSDAASWQLAQQLESRELLLSANYALTDFTAENGATCVVPGSHRWEAGRTPKSAEVCQAIMPRGSVLLYTGNVLHAGGANTTAEARVGLYLGYMASWLRPLENHLLTNRAEDVLALGDQAQHLLDVTPGGFTVYA